MTTPIYDLNEIAYSTQGWDTVLATDLEKLDDVIPTRSMITLGETVSAMEALYLNSDGKWYKALADGTSQPALGLALETGDLDDEIRLQVMGEATISGSTWDIGLPLYLSTTVSGGVTQTKPDANIQLVGYALTASKMILMTTTAGGSASVSDAAATKYISIRLLDKDTDVTVASGIGGVFEFPFDGEIIGVGAFTDVAGDTGTMTVDINNADETIMASDKIYIESGYKSSRDSATQPGITTTAVIVGDLFTFDIDEIHSGTAAKGLTVWMSVSIV